MKKYTWVLAILLLGGCDKQAPPPVTIVPPAMDYIGLGDVVAKKGSPVSYDLDQDGTADLRFSYQLVGDPLTQTDKHQFLATAESSVFFPFTVTEEVPVLVKGALIGNDHFPGHSWYNGVVIMAEKIVSNTHPPYWQGSWKSASHAFLPFYFSRGQQRYFGWMELSFSMTTESFVLHRMAICREPGQVAYAGY